jgi:predicted AlkP superfamily phosphohydrolase/phosphomutase
LVSFSVCQFQLTNCPTEKLKHFFGGGTVPRKLFVLSLDGTPYTLLNDAIAQGRLPHLRQLFAQGSFVQMDSVIPTISSVAWATFATGVNPARHGIFGFIDLDSQMRFVIPNAAHLAEKPLWQRLHDAGLRSIWINLPIAYPPAPINGVMISGFLGTQLEESVHPPHLLPVLQRLGYVIDPDPARAHTDPAGFLDDLFAALRARTQLTWHLFEREPWDFFLLHIMETDRLHHFYWDAKDDPHHPYHSLFWKLYSEIDTFVGELIERLPKGCELLLLSDHGFCRITSEVELNLLLQEREFLKFRNGPPQDFSGLSPHTRAFGLIPGRLYVRDRDYERTRSELIELLETLVDPQTHRPVIARVWRREEIYSGPQLSRAADILAVPHNGYDLKARLGATRLFTTSRLQGMHTGDDAFLFVRNYEISTQPKPHLVDLAPTLYALMGLPVPTGWEGRTLL